MIEKTILNKYRSHIIYANHQEFYTIGGCIFSYADIRPNGKAHCVLTSKRYCNTARELNQQE